MLRLDQALRFAGSFLAGGVAAIAFPSGQACTRVVYQGPNGHIITARSMDWKVDVGTNLWILPRGAQRSGEVGPNSLQWTSK